MKSHPAHDPFCDTLGCDALCPDKGALLGRDVAEQLLERRSDGTWPEGVSGNAKMISRRRRNELALISAVTDGGRQLVDGLLETAGCASTRMTQETALGLPVSEKVRFAARKFLVERFFGKRVTVNGTVKSEVTVSGAVTHAHAAIPYASLSQDALDKLEAAHQALLAELPRADVAEVVEDAVIVEDEDE